jgi:integrase
VTTIDPKHLAAFRRWAVKRYADRSVTKLVADVQACVRYAGEPPEASLRVARLRDYRWAWDVWAYWGGAGELPVPRPEVPKASKLGGRRAREPKRLREAVSYSREEYDALVKRAKHDEDPAARVVAVLARTGLRVGDVLRAPLGVLRAGIRRDDGVVTVVVKGGKPSVYSVRGGGRAESAWRDLLDVFHDASSDWTVAAALMGDADASPEAGHGAYTRVRRALARLGAEAGVRSRLHLHRFRRTVAVLLANAGATEAQIQKVLVHASPEITRGYIDEARALDSARLLDKIG